MSEIALNSFSNTPKANNIRNKIYKKGSKFCVNISIGLCLLIRNTEYELAKD